MYPRLSITILCAILITCFENPAIASATCEKDLKVQSLFLKITSQKLSEANQTLADVESLISDTFYVISASDSSTADRYCSYISCTSLGSTFNANSCRALVASVIEAEYTGTGPFDYVIRKGNMNGTVWESLIKAITHYGNLYADTTVTAISASEIDGYVAMVVPGELLMKP